jgi:hypothetical protein
MNIPTQYHNWGILKKIQTTMFNEAAKCFTCVLLFSAKNILSKFARAFL